MFDEIDKLLIREIQGDMPLTLDPYGDIAIKIGCSKEEVLQRLRGYHDRNIIKRIGIILYHRDSGYTENGMFTGTVPAEKLEEAGKALASIPNVSHCYERKVYPHWPYNLYGMFHGKSKTEIEQAVNKFVQDMDIKDYKILYSIEEFKKSSVEYF